MSDHHGISKINPLAIVGIVFGTLLAYWGSDMMINDYLVTKACENATRQYLLGCSELSYFGYGVLSTVIIFGIVLDIWSLKKRKLTVFATEK